MADSKLFDFTTLEHKFVRKLGNLVFRRVEDVKFRGPTRIVQFTPFGKMDDETASQMPLVISSGTEQRCPDGYSGVTSTLAINKTMKDFDEYVGYEIHFDSSRYAEIDIVQEGTFELKLVNNFGIYPHTNKGTGIYPDIICGIAENESDSDVVSSKLIFDKWFICSSQFMRLWMMVMAPDSQDANPPINKHYPKASTRYAALTQQRKWLMSGDRLCVNNFHKWVVSNKINIFDMENDEFLQKEIIRRFHRVRTESITRMWVHTYAALAMMIRFHTIPDGTNVPHNLDGETMGYWDLPELFCEKMLGMTEREADEEDDD